MSLADYTPERVTIEHKGQALVSVRGLCLDDVGILVRAHLHVLNSLADLSKRGDIAMFGGDKFILDVVTLAPNVAFDIIALAADEPEYTAQARKLPVGLQVKILQEVLRLTLEDVGGPLALMTLLQGLAREQKLLPENRATIQ